MVEGALNDRRLFLFRGPETAITRNTRGLVPRLQFSGFPATRTLCLRVASNVADADYPAVVETRGMRGNVASAGK